MNKRPIAWLSLVILFAYYGHFATAATLNAPVYHTVPCHRLVDLKDNTLVEWAIPHATRPNLNFSSTLVKKMPSNSPKEEIYAVTFVYTDMEPMYEEVIGLKIVDDQAPELFFLPTQPEHIPLYVECVETALWYAHTVIPGDYLPGVQVTDACQFRADTAFRYQYTNTPHDNTRRKRNSGILTIHYSGDDGKANTKGITQSITYSDTKGPETTPHALQNFNRWGVHERICVYGAQKTQVCLLEVLRHNAMTLTKDACDHQLIKFHTIHVDEVEVFTCQANNLHRCVVKDHSTSSSTLGLRGYENGAVVKIHFHNFDSQGNPSVDRLLLEVRFFDDVRSCRQYYQGSTQVAASDLDKLSSGKCSLTA